MNRFTFLYRHSHLVLESTIDTALECDKIAIDGDEGIASTAACDECNSGEFELLSISFCLISNIHVLHAKHTET